MAISKKNKNRVIVDDVEYLWWVFDEIDQAEFDGTQVKVVCSDQSHFIKYGLDQPENNRKVVLALRNYKKLVHLSFPPIFENEDGIITKSSILRLIKWCKKDNLKVQYAVDGMDNELSEQKTKEILEELQKRIN